MDKRWSKVEAGKVGAEAGSERQFSENGFYAFVLDLSFIQALGPSSLKNMEEGLIEKAMKLTNNVQPPSQKWITKNMSEALNLCRK